MLLSTSVDASPTVKYNSVNIGSPSVSQFQSTNGNGSLEDVEGFIYVYSLGDIGTGTNAVITIENLDTEDGNAFCAMTFSGVNQLSNDEKISPAIRLLKFCYKDS